MYLSTDGGASWRRTLDGQQINSVEFALSDPLVAYAAGFNCVFRSEDGGQTWRKVTSSEVGWGPRGINAGFPIDIQVDPRDPDRLFVNSYLGGNFLSEDGGVTWSSVSKGYTGAQSRDIAVDPDEPGRVVTASRSGIFQSLNGGADWTGLGFSPAIYVEWNAVAIDPEDGRHVLAGTNQYPRVAESRDGGRSWAFREAGLGEKSAFRVLKFAPSDTRTAYAGTGAFLSAGMFGNALPGMGVRVSHDGGKTWTAANDSLSASVQVQDLAVHPADAETVYVAALQNGLLKTTNGGDELDQARRSLDGAGCGACAGHRSRRSADRLCSHRCWDVPDTRRRHHLAAAHGRSSAGVRIHVHRGRPDGPEGHVCKRPPQRRLPHRERRRPVDARQPGPKDEGGQSPSSVLRRRPPICCDRGRRCVPPGSERHPTPGGGGAAGAGHVQ